MPIWCEPVAVLYNITLMHFAFRQPYLMASEFPSAVLAGRKERYHDIGVRTDRSGHGKTMCTWYSHRPPASCSSKTPVWNTTQRRK